MVYFVKAGDYIKIGYSKSEKAFKTRLSSYKTSCPFEVEVLGKIDGGVEEERNIMNYFIKFHTRGEWFNYDKSIEDFALNPYDIPKSNYLKPLHETNKIIDDNLEEMLELYRQGVSLRVIGEQFKVDRKRLIKYIPDDMKRDKNEWFKLRRRETNPKNIAIICTTTGEKFISTAEASRVLKISHGCIHRVLKGERKHTRQLVFMYYDKYLEQLEKE
jgi:hypothetical protein